MKDWVKIVLGNLITLLIAIVLGAVAFQVQLARLGKSALHVEVNVNRLERVAEKLQELPERVARNEANVSGNSKRQDRLENWLESQKGIVLSHIQNSHIHSRK